MMRLVNASDSDFCGTFSSLLVHATASTSAQINEDDTTVTTTTTTIAGVIADNPGSAIASRLKLNIADVQHGAGDAQDALDLRLAEAKLIHGALDGRELGGVVQEIDVNGVDLVEVGVRQGVAKPVCLQLLGARPATQLEEDVVVAFTARLPYHAALLEQVVCRGRRRRRRGQRTPWNERG